MIFVIDKSLRCFLNIHISAITLASSSCAKAIKSKSSLVFGDVYIKESLQNKGAAKMLIIIITGAIDDGKKRLPVHISREHIFWLQKPLVNGQLEHLVSQVLDQPMRVISGTLQ